MVREYSTEESMVFGKLVVAVRSAWGAVLTSAVLLWEFGLVELVVEWLAWS